MSEETLPTPQSSGVGKHFDRILQDAPETSVPEPETEPKPEAITSGAASYFDQILRESQKKTEKPTTPEIQKAEPSETGKFFDSIQQNAQPLLPHAKSQMLAALYEGKDINNLEPQHQKFMSDWTPQDWYDLKKIRPDFAIPEDKQREIYNADEAGQLKHPSNSEGLWDVAKNFSKGVAKLNDSLSIWTSPVRTLSTFAAAKLYGAPTDQAAQFALESSKGTSEASGKFIYNAIKAKTNGASYTDALRAGHQAAASVGAPVSPEVAIRSYVAPTLELPGELAWTSQKLAQGGNAGIDWLLKKTSPVTGTTDEDLFRRWQARENVDTANAILDRAHPTVYGKMMFHPWVQAGLKTLIKSTAPGLSDEEAAKGAEEVAGQVEKEQGSVDKDIEEVARWTNPVGGFGEIGYAGDLLTVLRNAKPLIRAATMTKEAQMALEAKELADRVVARSQPTWFAKAAGKTADVVENLQAAAENFPKNYPLLAKLGTPLIKYSPGALIGAHENEKNPILGALEGVAVEAAGLKGIKLAAAVPRTLEELSLARSLSAGGKKGMFEQAGGMPEVSDLTRNLFEKHGKTIDALGHLLLDYGKEGVNMAALGAATGLINSQNYDEIMDGAKNGLLFAALGKTFHKVIRQDPSATARKLRQQDVDNFKTMSEMSPETVDKVRGMLSWDNEVSKAQSDVQTSKALYEAAVRSGDQKLAKNLGDRLLASQKHLELVSNADVPTRQAYERQLMNLLTAFHNDINGSLRVGPKNAKIEILSGDQIKAQIKKNNPNLSEAQIDAIVDGGHFTAGISNQGFIPGKDIPAALRPDGSKVVFDPLAPTAVINVDHLFNEAMQTRQPLYEALRHEFGHLLDLIPEWRELNADAEESLFDDPATGKTGRFSNKELVKMYTDKYLDKVNDPKQWAINRGHYDELNDRLDEDKIAEYMKREVRADLNSQAYTSRNLDTLDSIGQHMMDWLSIKSQNSKGYRAIQKFLGLGGKDPYSNTASVATGAKFSPEVLAAYRNAIREFRKLNGMVSTPTASESVMPMITRAKLAARKDLRDKYGKDSGLFKTEFRATVLDKDGNVVGHGVITDPAASEGLWGMENGSLNQRSGYGSAPSDLSGIQVPEGGSVKVSREIVMKADGETPEMLSQKEIRQLVKTRAGLIRDALDNAYQGEPNGFRPVSEDGLTYRGNFTPAQIAALRALPESIVPAKIKDVILRFNDLLQTAEGRRMIIDYAARVDDRGRAVSFAPKIYDLVPIGMHFSKEGNFLITCISVSRLFDKLNLWADRLPGRLAPWGGSREAFFQQFVTDYLPNHLKQWDDPNLPEDQRATGAKVARPGEVALDPDPKVALEKKNIFNDFLNLTSNEFRDRNPDRTVVPRRKEDPRGKDPNRTIMSVRADSVADMLESSAHPIPINYELQKWNYMPTREGGTKAPEKPAPTEEQNPILKALGAIKATYVAPDQRTPYAQPVRGANQDVQQISKNYVESAGMTYRPHGQAVPVNEELAKRIADHYATAKNEPLKPEVKKAYSAMANEVVDQWKAFEQAGYTATPWTGEGQPYANSAEMMKDVRDNKHLYYFQTKEGYGESGITAKMRAENPMLQDSGVNFNGADNVPVNDVFRVVHDIVGHGAHGYEFGPKGEFNAYLEHSRMFSDAAKPALAAETLSQNSWVNYGPHLRDEAGNIAKKGEKGYVPVTERPFAEQKNIALPQEFIDAAEKEAQAGTKQGPSFLPAKITRKIGENEKFLNQPKEEEAKAALDSSKQPKFGTARGLKKGYPVALRIDIPAFNRTGNYVVTVHEKGTPSKVGEVIGYDTVARVDNPTFVSNETGAGKIYRGESKKFPIATVTGDFNPSREIPKDINDWTPVGFDPKEHSYFYDKATDEPVTGGDEAVSVGNTVFVKNPVYGDRSNVSFLPAGKTESPAFKKWFEDSQVVDEKGKPRVMYHGTGTGFTKFDKGGYFAFDPEFADKFANRAASGFMAESEYAYNPKYPDEEQAEGFSMTPVIMPVYLKSKNIFDANNPEHMRKIGKAPGTFGDYQQIENNQDRIKKAGFDGYYDYEYGTDRDKTGIYVYNPEQVKSATGNVGTYSAENPDIAFLPAKGETKSVPTQEELNEMKARLPEYTSQIKETKKSSPYGTKSTHYEVSVYAPGETEPAGTAEIEVMGKYPGYLQINDIARKPGSPGMGEALYREIAKYAQSIGATELGGLTNFKSTKRRETLFETLRKDETSGETKEEDKTYAMTSKVEPGISYLPAKKLTVQHPSEEKEGSVGGDLDLVHFGTSGLKVADPKKFGKGAATPMDLRGAPKTYFYLNNDRNYEGLMKGRTPYVAKVDGNSIYDLSKDPLGVAGMMNREKMDNMIEDAGYAGYFSPKSYNGAFDAIAMFKKTKLTEVQQGREIFKTPKKSKEFGIQYLPAKKGVDGGTETEETLPTDESQTESYTQAQGAGFQAGGQSQEDRNRLLGGLASVARGAQISGAEGVQGAEGTAPRKEVEEAALRKHADENGMMRDPDEFFNQWQLDGSEAGGEHQVSFPPGDDVVKRTPNPYYPTWADYFDSLQIHNTLFPKAALTFRGLQNVEGSGGVDIDGTKWPAGLYSEVSQPFLKIKRGLTVPETDELMKTIGFRRTLPMEYVNDDLGIKIKDLHGMNAVMLEDENGKEFPYVIDSTIVPTKAAEEQPRVRLDGNVTTESNPEATFVASPKILAQFMPAKGVDLEKYKDRPIISLPADRMGVGKAYVGPSDRKKEASIERQGGPAFPTIYFTKDNNNNPVWAFSTEDSASRFCTRVRGEAKTKGVGSVLIAPTLLSATNLLHSPSGQQFYVDALKIGIELGDLKKSKVDAHVKEILSRVKASSDVSEDQKKIIGKAKTLNDLADLVGQKLLNFKTGAALKERAGQATLPISIEDMEKFGISPSVIAQSLSHEGFFNLPDYSIVSLFEVPADVKPEKGDFHHSYPYIVRGKPIGFLKNLFNLRDVTSDPRIFNKKGQITAQPVMSVLPALDPVKINQALKDLRYIPAP